MIVSGVVVEVTSCNGYNDFCDEEMMIHQRFRRSQTDKETNRTLMALTVSRTLDSIFDKKRYDPKIRNVVLLSRFLVMTYSCRPDNYGQPTIVDVNIFIR